MKQRWAVLGLAPGLLFVCLGCAVDRTHANRKLLRALSDRDAAAAEKALRAGADARSKESTPAPFDPQSEALYPVARRGMPGAVKSNGAATRGTEATTALRLAP